MFKHILCAIIWITIQQQAFAGQSIYKCTSSSGETNYTSIEAEAAADKSCVKTDLSDTNKLMVIHSEKGTTPDSHRNEKHLSNSSIPHKQQQPPVTTSKSSEFLHNESQLTNINSNEQAQLTPADWLLLKTQNWEKRKNDNKHFQARRYNPRQNHKHIN